MIQYIIIHEHKKVKAILENTEYDACNKISKMLRDTPFCAVSNKYLMPNRFVAEVQCDERDEFNVEFGMKRAKKILLDNYHKSLDKKITHFRKDVLAMNSKVFEIPAELENNT